MRHLDFNRTSAEHVDCVKPVRGRKLTAILYLNDEWDGGQLRIHLPKPSNLPASFKSCTTKTDTNETRVIVEPHNIFDNDNEEQTEYFDVDPKSGRLVIFRRLVTHIMYNTVQYDWTYLY